MRPVDRLVSGMQINDGAEVRLSRIIGQPALSELDPFLLLDVFRSDVAGDYIEGFPEHPHRGLETVAYVYAACGMATIRAMRACCGPAAYNG